MKTKNILITFMAIAFSVLFYKQQSGINLSIFAFILIVYQISFNRSLIKSTIWIFTAVIMITFSILALIYPYQHVPLFAFIAIGVFCGISSDTRISIITSFIHSLFNALSGAIALLVQKMENYIALKPVPTAPAKNKSSYKWFHFGTAFTITLIFIFLYRDSSAAFTYVTNKIDLSFISIGWIFFTLLSFVVLLGVLRSNKVFDFIKVDLNKSNSTLYSYSFMKEGFFNSGITLFILLNILLTIVNFSDIYFLFNFDSTNNSISYAEMIHQGINSLFFSLFLAVIFIMIWTNRIDAKNKISKTIKFLSAIWIFENLILISTTFLKNNMYIDTYGLTNLRIEVYLSLAISLTILSLCFYKIWRNKNNWYLFRAKGIVLSILLLVYSTINTDAIIAKHNIELYKKGKIYPDTYYLLQLSEQVIPILYENWDILNPEENQELNQQFDYKILKFRLNNSNYEWPSYNLSRSKVLSFINNNYIPLSSLNYQQLEERYNPYSFW